MVEEEKAGGYSLEFKLAVVFDWTETTHSAKEICKHFGISANLFYRWRRETDELLEFYDKQQFDKKKRKKKASLVSLEEEISACQEQLKKWREEYYRVYADEDERKAYEQSQNEIRAKENVSELLAKFTRRVETQSVAIGGGDDIRAIADGVGAAPSGTKQSADADIFAEYAEYNERQRIETNCSKLNADEVSSPFNEQIDNKSLER